MTMAPPRIEQLAERPDLLPVVAAWIYQEWWTAVDGASVGTLTDLLRAHLVPHQMPLTLVASLEMLPVGTATLLVHDVGTEQWSELSPWLAAVYVAPEFRHRGIGAALVSAIAAKARALGVEALYLQTVGSEKFYAHLGWQVLHRAEEKIVMSKPTAGSQ
ncbi:MAG: family N-acetyltransferase [Gammaproteobacteria bacterium]|nr:family N-acetyltransferase [Gammaproteobacteria bacterium]